MIEIYAGLSVEVSTGITLFFHPASFSLQTMKQKALQKDNFGFGRKGKTTTGLSLQRRNFIVNIFELTKQSLLPVTHHVLWVYTALYLLLDPKRCQQGTVFACEAKKKIIKFCFR